MLPLQLRERVLHLSNHTRTIVNIGSFASHELNGAALRELQKGKGSPYSITERRVPDLIPVLGSQPAGDVSHKPGGRLPLLFARPAVTPATLKRAATNGDAHIYSMQSSAQYIV